MKVYQINLFPYGLNLFFDKKKTLAQVFSKEVGEIINNTFFTEHLRWLLLLILI